MVAVAVVAVDEAARLAEFGAAKGIAAGANLLRQQACVSHARSAWERDTRTMWGRTSQQCAYAVCKRQGRYTTDRLRTCQLEVLMLCLLRSFGSLALCQVFCIRAFGLCTVPM